MKRSKLRVKSIELEERDYRGLLALLLVGIAASAQLLGEWEAAKALMPLAAMAVGWYFGRKG